MRNLAILAFCLFVAALSGQTATILTPNDTTTCVAMWGGCPPYLIETTGGFSAITPTRTVCWTTRRGEKMKIKITDARGVPVRVEAVNAKN